MCSVFHHIHVFSSVSHSSWSHRELRIRDFDHPPCCPKCVSHSEEWLVMSQEEGSSAMGRHMMVFIPDCLLLVKEDYFSSSQDLNFNVTLPSAFNFTLRTASVVCGSCKGGAGKVTLIQPIE